MSAFVNDRDVLLQASAQRNVNPTLGKALLLISDTPVFRVAAGAAAPAVATLTAKLLGVYGVATWEISGGTLTGTDDNERTLAFVDMSAETAVITATVVDAGVSYIASTIISKLSSGNFSYTWIKYGTSAAGAGLSDSPAGKTYIGLAYNKATADESDNPEDYTWSLIKGTDGVPGLPGKDGEPTYTWIKYSDNADGTGLYDIPTAGTLYIGIAVNKNTAVEGTTKTDYAWSKFKGDQGVAGSQGAPGSNGLPGTRGTVTIASNSYGGTWSDANAVAAISAAGYGMPVNRDIVTLYSGSISTTKFYQSGDWYVLTAYIHGNMLVSGTLSAAAITAGTMSADRISGGVFTGTEINIASGQFRVLTSGVMQSVGALMSNCRAAQTSPGSYALEVSGSLSTLSPSPGPVALFSSNNAATALQAIAAGTAITASGATALYADGGISMPPKSAGAANTVLNSVIAATDNAYQCGFTGARWANIYAVNNVIQTSDVRTKTDIVDSDLGLSFINSLRPVSYRMIVGQNDVTTDWVIPYADQVVTVTPRAGQRRHYGLIAQEVRAALGEANIAIWSLDNKDDPDSPQALTYTELIAPLIKAVQEQHALMQEQHALILALTARIAALETLPNS